MKSSDLLMIAQIGFVLITLISFGLLVKEFNTGSRQTTWAENQRKKFISKILVALFIWMVFVSAWSLSGVMGNFTKFPFNFMPVILIPLITAIIITFSKSFNEILKHIPSSHLIRLQSFRVFVELLLWILFIANIAPVQMTFEGRNFDIISGLSAPIIAWLASQNKISKKWLIVWNVICLGLLINIVTVAILSTPSPLRVFMNEPSNTIVTIFPFSWLPGFLVPLAYILHFLSLKQLLNKPSSGLGV